MYRPLTDAAFWIRCREQRKKLALRRVQEHESESDSWNQMSQQMQPKTSDRSKKGIVKFESYNSGIKRNDFSSIKANCSKGNLNKVVMHSDDNKKWTKKVSSMKNQILQKKPFRLVEGSVNNKDCSSNESDKQFRMKKDTRQSGRKRIHSPVLG